MLSVGFRSRPRVSSRLSGGRCKVFRAWDFQSLGGLACDQALAQVLQGLVFREVQNPQELVYRAVGLKVGRAPSS